jgi:hypothetical protein
MKRIENAYAIDSRFREADLTHPKTPMTATWLNSVQEELCHVIEAEGGVLDPADDNQLLTALTRKRDRPQLYQSWEIPARFDEEIPPERIDATLLKDHRFCMSPLPVVGEAPEGNQNRFMGSPLPGWRFDKTKIISASFMALIERESEHQAFYMLVPYSVLYWGDFGLRRNQLGDAYWIIDKSYSVSLLRPLHGDHTNFNLYASLLIDREGQMWIAGKNAEEGNYRGRISIYDLKTVKPIP